MIFLTRVSERTLFCYPESVISNTNSYYLFRLVWFGCLFFLFVFDRSSYTDFCFYLTAFNYFNNRNRFFFCFVCEFECEIGYPFSIMWHKIVTILSIGMHHHTTDNRFPNLYIFYLSIKRNQMEWWNYFCYIYKTAKCIYYTCCDYCTRALYLFIYFTKIR